MKYPVVLASASPRRHELLAQLVPEFQIAVADVDEADYADEDPWEAAESIASAKALEVATRYPDSLVIGGDTIVAFDVAGLMVQLAKPVDRDDAISMLESLSGRKHVVITGVCLASPDGGSVFTATTAVTFRALNREEIERYVDTGEPMDKAGAYAIQGGAAGFVTSIEGSLSNVIGLPLEALAEALQRLGAAG